MPPIPADRPPQQARSRRTLARLLAATIGTLDEVGLENATIPRIARKAEVSPATIYRRFENKQALLRAAFLHMLECINEGNRGHLGEKLSPGPLERAVHVLIELMFAQLRMNGGLLLAMDQFRTTESDTAFIRAAQAIEEDNLNLVIQAMLVHRAEITHPIPELAVRIATLTTVTAIRTRAFKPQWIWRTVQPTTEQALMDEFARAYVAYLQSGT